MGNLFFEKSANVIDQGLADFSKTYFLLDGKNILHLSYSRRFPTPRRFFANQIGIPIRRNFTKVGLEKP